MLLLAFCSISSSDSPLELKLTEGLFQVLVQWQDATISEEKATSLGPCENADDHDVWPGDRVSYISEQEKIGSDDNPLLRLNKIGVVQCVHPSRRTAHVRWYKDPSITIDVEERLIQPTSVSVSLVPLYQDCDTTCEVVSRDVRDSSMCLNLLANRANVPL